MWLALTGMFAFGGLWFWALICLETFILFWCIGNDDDIRYVSATVSFIIFALILIFFGNRWWITTVITNPLLLLPIFGGYIVGGVVWSMIKTYYYVTKHNRRFNRDKEEWMEIQKIDPESEIPEEGQIRDKWDNYLARKYSYGSFPTFRNTYGKIIFWMIYWPFSMVWTLINDPIRRIFKAILEELNFIYKKMFDKYLGDITKEIDKARERRS